MIDPGLNSYYGNLLDCHWQSEIFDIYKFLLSLPNPQDIYIAYNPIWPSHQDVVVPTNKQLYVLGWGGEQIDVAWIKKLLTTVPIERVILLTDLEFTSVPEVKTFRFIHHHYLTKTFGSTKDFVPTFKHRKFKSSALINRATKEKVKLIGFIEHNAHVMNNFDTLQKGIEVKKLRNTPQWSNDTWEWRIPPFLDCVTNITTESIFENSSDQTSYTYLTEKSFKPFMAGCVGIHYGQVGGYAKLKEYGFKTADLLGFTYDTIYDEERRLEVFNKEINEFLNSELDYDTLEGIAVFNHQYYWNEFFDNIHERNKVVARNCIDYINSIM